MFRRHGNLAVLHAPLFCFSRPSLHVNILFFRVSLDTILFCLFFHLCEKPTSVKSFVFFVTFIIVVLMHADPNLESIFRLFLPSFFGLVLFWRRSLHCCLLLRAAEGWALLVFPSMPALLLELLLMLAVLTRGSEAAQCCYGETIKIDSPKCCFYFKSPETLLCQSFME